MNHLIERLKEYLTNRWGLLTPEQHTKLLKKALENWKAQTEHAIMVRENERLALHADNKRLKDRVRDAEEELAFIKADFKATKIARPTVVKVEDF